MALYVFWRLVLGVVALIFYNKPYAVEAQNVLNHRLPSHVVPNHYVIQLVPFYPDFFELFGTVKISVMALEEANNITLHANYLRFNESSVYITDSEGQNLPIVEHGHETDTRHFYTLHLEDPLTVNETYEIYMEYIGELRDDMYGFYRSSYTVGNEVRWLAVTQFESTHARRAFPCFDEPHFKATFDISIAHYPNLTAIANTPKKSTSEPDPTLDNRVWDIFETTVPMSTYLVAFLVSDFEYITNDDQNFTVWARGEVIQNGHYSQIIGPASLKYLEEYTGLLYPLGKVDQVALPDFAAGAMENWGLITYRETALLYNEGTSTASSKASVAMTIAHEVTHQWFGNLVTLNWWRYTWLNEGFARYFQYVIVDSIETTWRLMDQFVVAQLQSVFSTDALITSSSLNSDVMSPGEIDSKFSTISYSKGACVIRMIRHSITEDTFKKGIRTYLSGRQYDTAIPSHLYDALQQHALADNKLDPSVGTIESLFGKWASQAGYPVITVTRNYNQNTATVTQERFLLARPEQDRTETWSIPLSWVKQSDALTGFGVTTPNEWFKDSEASHSIANIAPANEWVIFNKQETGYYRVNYDTENWNKIITFLQSNAYTLIHILNRAQLVDDSLNLARADYLSYDIALGIAEYLVQETDYIPWYPAFNGFSLLNRLLANSDAYPLFQEYLLELLQKSYESTGFLEGPYDAQLTIYHRSNVINWACTLGHEDCVSQAKQQFEKWNALPNPDAENPISPNIRSLVYCTAAANGGENEWNFLWDRYTRAEMASEKSLLLSALGCSKSATILESYLQKSITENSGIRKQDAASVFSSVYGNRDGIDIALNFFIRNFQQITNYYGGMGAISNSLTGIASRLTTEEQVTSLRQFVNNNEANLGSAATAAKNAVESAQSNLDWKTKYYETIENWLFTRAQTSTVPEESTTEGSASLYHSFILIITMLLISSINIFS